MSGLLSGRRVLVTGVLTEASLASAVTLAALEHGAEVLLTSPLCRAMGLTRRVAPRLGVSAEVLELDVTLPEDLAGLAEAVRGAGWDRVDGVLHAMAYVPGGTVGTTFSAAPWDDVAQTLQASTWSLAALVHALRPLLPRGASVVGLDLDASRAWPSQDWLGVAQAGLEATARYLARELGPAGVRVNLVASGPVRTMTSRAVPGFDDLADGWQRRAPLGWDPTDASAVGTAVVALLSDLLPATTGEVLHVDGGFHAIS